MRRSFIPVHCRGRVLVDLAVMLAVGGEAIDDINVLRHQAALLGSVAAAPTVWRALDELTLAAFKRMNTARARVRRHWWAQLSWEAGVPVSKVGGTDLGEAVVHGENENASATFKRTFGFHSLGVRCDNTGRFLAAMLRAGRAGSNTAVNHIEVLGAATAQILALQRKNLLIRADGAGASQGLLDWLTAQGQVRGRRLKCSAGYAVTEKIRATIKRVPKAVRTPATDADGGVREGGEVADLTRLLDLNGWPAAMWIIVQRKRPHPGGQLSLFGET